VNAILAISLELRLACLFALGLAAGSAINLAVYSLAWRPRPISPWTRTPDGIAARAWPARLPIVGWWFLRREASWHGRGFWIRPLLVELATAAMFVVLYLWDVEWSGALVVAGAAPPTADFLNGNLSLVLHARWAAHVVLVSLMLVASLIDFDEKTIPDAITVWGTLAGLMFAAAYPWSLLPGGDWLVGGQRQVTFLTLASPEPWPDALGGWPQVMSLAIALGCWTLWCGGLLPRRWNTRRGWTTATRVFFHRLRVESMTYRIAAMWLVGAVAIVVAHRALEKAHWAGLLTALVGAAVGGGVVWIVRNVGTAALQREAMGFGDVTLMSMIATFIGWQGALVVFFLAPFFGLILGLAERLTNGEHEIPYGPFLCLATLLVIVQWPAIWLEVEPIFSMGWLLGVVMAGAMILLGIMLLTYRLLLERLSNR
jgi:leader peptidase (prepilin peptidase)/N-methyltransferase